MISCPYGAGGGAAVRPVGKRLLARNYSLTSTVFANMITVVYYRGVAAAAANEKMLERTGE